MRAKTLNEVQNFERGNDPKTSLNIGKAAKIKEILDRIYARDHFLTYKIKSPDHIEIHYTEDIKSKVKNPEDVQTVWILQYVEKERYIIKEESYEMSSFTHSFGTKYEYRIYEVKFNADTDPKRMKFEEELILDMNKQDKQNEERIKIICDALNKHYGKVGGFLLTETHK